MEKKHNVCVVYLVHWRHQGALTADTLSPSFLTGGVYTGVLCFVLPITLILLKDFKLQKYCIFFGNFLLFCCPDRIQKVRAWQNKKALQVPIRFIKNSNQIIWMFSHSITSNNNWIVILLQYFHLNNVSNVKTKWI